MNILILDSWLREYLKTKATAQEIAKYLSLSSQSVQNLTKLDNDWLYEIEVTTNRPDALSVYGIARELSAILPYSKIETKLTPIKAPPISKPKTSLPLKVKISDNSLVPRFTALVFDEVVIKPSAKKVQKRLEASGIRSLNNVIDISNYLMLELGQPMHTFDYDKILGAEMTVREAKKGEKIITLDGQLRRLAPGTIIIEDGEKRIIDLCGIMGAKNSEVDEKTKRVLLFVQTYDPLRIRRSCQALGFWTEAASRFEKGIDPEGVMTAMKRASLLFKDWAEARVASRLFDIYPSPPKALKVSLEKSRLDKIMGIDISLKQAGEILKSLGFEIKILESQEKLVAKVPHWRAGDIAIPEDLIEEIARIYGYQNFSNQLPPISFPGQTEPLLEWENQLKEALNFWGFTETPTHSLTSAQLLDLVGIEKKNLLYLANPLSTDLLYLRVSLLPRLLEVALKNINYEKIKIFEIANIYPSQGKNQLPDERPRLAGLISPGEYQEAKGTVEAILENLGIENASFSPTSSTEEIYLKLKTADITIGKQKLGTLGLINPSILKKFGLPGKIAFFDLDLKELTTFATKAKRFTPISKYPPIVEDFSFVVPPGITAAEIEETIKMVSPLIKRVELIDLFRDTRTFRITYQSAKGNLTDQDIKPIREKITKELSKKEIILRG